MKKFILVFLITSFGFLGCTDRDDDIASINLRIRNVSSIQFDRILIGGEALIFENVAPDSYSSYSSIAAFRFFETVTIESGEETFMLESQIGDTNASLPIGLYTYELNIDSQGQVLLELVYDY